MFLFPALLGSDVNKPDRHGKTPLHLAHSRLRILRMKGGDEAAQTTLDRKRETENVNKTRFLASLLSSMLQHNQIVCFHFPLNF